MLERAIKITEDLRSIAESLGEKRAAANLNLLQARLCLPTAWVSLVGETSVGKSTLLNSFLEHPILPVGAQPVSGSLVQILCSSRSPERYLAIYQDATQEELSLDAFQKIAVEPPKDLLRLQLRTPVKGDEWDDLQLFDTPGSNSIAEYHAETLLSILPDSNLIVLVVGYATGFGQAEHDLYQHVADAISGDTAVPLLLVVNRVPSHIGLEDKRIAEITSRAADVLARSPEVLLIRNSPADVNGKRTLPDTVDMWKRVHALSVSDDVLNMYARNVHSLLFAVVNMLNESITVQRSQAYEIIAGREMAEAEANRFEHLAEQSSKIIQRTFARLRTRIPHFIDVQSESVKSEVFAEINNSGKWLDAEPCKAYIEMHIIPYLFNKIGADTMRQVEEELKRMDVELDDLAQTAIKELDSYVEKHQGTPMADLAASLALSITKKIVSSIAMGAVKGLGGVGGAAAGMGNLAKMILKRVGGVFGKTFSRETYTTIGRIFTKEAMKRAGFVFTIAIEAIQIIWDAHTWKSKLETMVCKHADEIVKQMKDDILDTTLPELEQYNLKNVPETFFGISRDIRAGLQNSEDKVRVERFEQLQNQIAMIIDDLKGAA